MQQADEQPALIKILITWLAVGVSQMTPLQFVQFVAAIFAIVYSGIQIYKTLRDLWRERTKGPR